LGLVSILESIKEQLESIKELPIDEKIEIINQIKMELHLISPMKGEPVDCVIWVPAETVEANDYNPNSVASPEMKLLQHSIREDGYTQPIVAFNGDEGYVVIDGFHRNRVGKECKDIHERVKGYLPITIIKSDKRDRENRIASTIRHNRARGKHQVEAMSEIIVELSKRNWSDTKIAKELGMDADEVLRLKQITGLAEMFSDREFSEAWDV
jgi:ParB-like chromosome segregation protein Spo0J